MRDEFMSDFRKNNDSGLPLSSLNKIKFICHTTN